MDQYKNDGTVNKNSGHAYLIDYIKEVQISYYDVYAHKSGSNIDDEDDDENLTSYGSSLDYFYNKYGTIDTSFAGNESEYWLSMNWGWGGQYDDLLLNAELSTWNVYRANDRLVFFYTTMLK